MSVQKFKTFEEAERQLWELNPDQEYYRSLTKLFGLFNTLNPVDCEKGIHKFKTFEEANRHRQQTIILKK